MPCYSLFSPRLATFAGLGALVAAGPAGAASRQACDRLPGRTVAANTQLRVFVVPRDRKAERDTALAVCAVKTRKVNKLAYGKRSVKLAKVAVSGSMAAVVEWKYSNIVGNNAGVSFTYVHTIDVKSRRENATGVLTGVVTREIAMTPDGAVAVIGTPFGSAYGSGDEPSAYKRGAAGVFVADGRVGKGALWNELDSGPETSLSGLTFSGSTLVWQNGSVLRSSPLA